MHYHHLYAAEDGESHWRRVEVPLTERSFAPPAKAIFVSEPEPAVASVFLRLDPGWNEPIHPTPKRQTLFCLGGAVRVTASDGEARVIAKGDIWRMEDTHGKGHHTETIGSEPFEAALVQFD
jgi:quercetin dioxygenase-like cupin family protein